MATALRITCPLSSLSSPSFCGIDYTRRLASSNVCIFRHHLSLPISLRVPHQYHLAIVRSSHLLPCDLSTACLIHQISPFDVGEIDFAGYTAPRVSGRARLVVLPCDLITTE